MTLPRYPAYKDSGVEWLGEVPVHWNVFKLKRCVSLLTEKTNRRSNPVGLENIEGWSGRFVPSESDFQGEGVAFEPGDVLFGKLRPYLAKAMVADKPGEAVGDFHVMRPRRGTGGEFLAYQIRTQQFVSIVDGSTYGAKMPRVNWEFMGGMPLSLPPEEEQTLITAFLDHEASKIDTLIAEQQNLIALLKEKRQAVISHAVTKGLNPDVPMKDSGVEWLGEVPEHWVTPPLSFRYTSELGKMLDTARISGDHPVPYLRNVDVQWDRFNLDDLPVMDIKPSEYERYTVKPGDLMVCEGGEVGRTAIVPHISGVLGFQKALHRLRAASSAEIPRFMFYTLSCAASLGVFTMAGLSTIAHLTGEQLRRYRFPTPPPDEQTAIVAFLDRETAKIDRLIAEGEHAVDLLQERRAALISSAVTGKIDVRGLMRQEAA